mmetsp:Transcript_77573/g.251149  ORF Transcript_77573/g.251149 Transcript_77573/m.251149 type:complete len:94 (+) Transcript_77573:2176-2457(+)
MLAQVDKRGSRDRPALNLLCAGRESTRRNQEQHAGVQQEHADGACPSAPNGVTRRSRKRAQRSEDNSVKTPARRRSARISFVDCLADNSTQST